MQDHGDTNIRWSSFCGDGYPRVDIRLRRRTRQQGGLNYEKTTTTIQDAR